MNLYDKNISCARQNSNINYIHVETLQAKHFSNNDVKQLKSQEAKQQDLSYIIIWNYM